MSKPTGATHIDNDRCYWMNRNRQWFHYNDVFGWCAYVGPLNKDFFGKLREVAYG